MEYEEIKIWLKSNRIPREDFAARLGVSKSTVNNWLAGVFPIPEKKIPLITAMMEGGSLATPAPAHSKVSAADFKTFPVLLSNEDYELCLHAADAAGLSVSDWAADVCAAEAAAFTQKEAAEAAAQQAGQGSGADNSAGSVVQGSGSEQATQAS